MQHGAPNISRFFLYGGIAFQACMTGGIELEIADVTIQSGERAGVDQTHPVEPVREPATRAFYPATSPCASKP